MRLQSSKTQKYTGGLLKFLTSLVCSMKTVNASQLVTETLDSIQPKLFSMLLSSVLLPEIKSVTATADRKTLLVALGKILNQAPVMSTPDYQPLWSAYIGEMLRLSINPLIKDVQPTMEEEELYTMDVEEAGYQSAFARLHSISKSMVDYAADVQDLNGFVRDALQQFVGRNQPMAAQTLQSLPADLTLHLKSIGVIF